MNQHINEQIERLRALPEQLEALVAGLSDEDMTTAFLPGEWTVAQNIHHVADVHMQFFFRFKVILLGDHPTITPFEQNDFAESPDAVHAGISESLDIIRGVHQRWVRLAESMSEAQWAKSGHHPETGELFLTALFPYAAQHGYVHIEQIRKTLAARA